MTVKSIVKLSTNAFQGNTRILLSSLQRAHPTPEVKSHFSFHGLSPALSSLLSSCQFLFKAPINLPRGTTALRRGSMSPTLCLLLPSGSPLMLAEEYLSLPLYSTSPKPVRLQFARNVTVRLYGQSLWTPKIETSTRLVEISFHDHCHKTDALTHRRGSFKQLC